MRKFRRCLTFLTLAFATTGMSGCQLLTLIPQTTWKLNRGPALDEGPAYFSVPDPQPVDEP